MSSGCVNDDATGLWRWVRRLCALVPPNDNKHRRCAVGTQKPTPSAGLVSGCRRQQGAARWTGLRRGVTASTRMHRAEGKLMSRTTACERRGRRAQALRRGGGGSKRSCTGEWRLQAVVVQPVSQSVCVPVELRHAATGWWLGHRGRAATTRAPWPCERRARAVCLPVRSTYKDVCWGCSAGACMRSKLETSCREGRESANGCAESLAASTRHKCGVLDASAWCAHAPRRGAWVPSRAGQTGQV